MADAWIIDVVRTPGEEGVLMAAFIPSTRRSC